MDNDWSNGGAMGHLTMMLEIGMPSTLRILAGRSFRNSDVLTGLASDLTRVGGVHFEI